MGLRERSKNITKELKIGDLLAFTVKMLYNTIGEIMF